MGEARIFKGQYVEAVIILTRALERGNKDRDTRFNMALALQRRNGPGDENNSKEILDDIIKEDKKDRTAALTYALFEDKENMLAVVKGLVIEIPSLKTRLRDDWRFGKYRDDPEFKAIVGG